MMVFSNYKIKYHNIFSICLFERFLKVIRANLKKSFMLIKISSREFNIAIFREIC